LVRTRCAIIWQHKVGPLSGKKIPVCGWPILDRSSGVALNHSGRKNFVLATPKKSLGGNQQLAGSFIH
jgi:hypothetical protein